jgi:hypothetical protein
MGQYTWLDEEKTTPGHLNRKKFLYQRSVTISNIREVDFGPNLGKTRIQKKSNFDLEKILAIEENLKEKLLRDLRNILVFENWEKRKMIANGVRKRLEKFSKMKGLERFVKELLDPSELASLMKKIKNQEIE